VSGRIRLDPRAADELDQAAAWYERQRVGLGRDLVLAVGAAVRALARSPRAGAPVDRVDPTIDVRRVRVRRFPYQVVYVMHAEDIVVIAVAHDRRRQGYWAGRVGSTE
jgi:plasmid stabilization system protein ParE